MRHSDRSDAVTTEALTRVEATARRELDAFKELYKSERDHVATALKLDAEKLDLKMSAGARTTASIVSAVVSLGIGLIVAAFSYALR